MTLLPDLERALSDAVGRRAAGTSEPAAAKRRRTRTKLAAVVLGLTVSVTAVAAGAALIVDRPAAPEAERRLPVVGGAGTSALADYRGATTIVSFYASWCLPCRDQARLVDRLGEELRAQGGGAAVLIAVHDDDRHARAFIDREKLSIPVLGDPDDAVAAAYGIQGVPVTVVLDRAGRVAASLTGLQTEAQLRTAVAEASAPAEPGP